VKSENQNRGLNTPTINQMAKTGQEEEHLPQSPFLPRRVTAATDVRLRDRGVYILAGLIEPTPARESVLEGQSPFDAIERCDASQRPPGSAGRASRQRDQTVFTAVPQFAQFAAITLGTPPRRDAPRIVLRQ
jgi:hypothetical protein